MRRITIGYYWFALIALPVALPACSGDPIDSGIDGFGGSSSLPGGGSAGAVAGAAPVAGQGGSTAGASSGRAGSSSGGMSTAGAPPTGSGGRAGSGGAANGGSDSGGAESGSNSGGSNAGGSGTAGSKFAGMGGASSGGASSGGATSGAAGKGSAGAAGASMQPGAGQCSVTQSGATGDEPGGQIPVCCAPTASEKTSIEEVFRLLNAHRMANGLSALAYDAELEAAIQGHCLHMAQHTFFDHTAPEAAISSPWTRAELCGTSANGENIARGQRSPADVMTGWTNSDGHNQNMLGNFRRVGIGYEGTARNWGQLFAR